MRWAILGDHINQIKVPVDISPRKSYSQLTVKMYHKGVVKRGDVSGIEIGSKQYLAKSQQFILSKIDARNGAMGLIPEGLNNSIVTGDFLLFETDSKTLLPKYFNYITSARQFDKFCHSASEGSTNRRRLKIPKFYDIKIPLPPLPEQKRIVKKLDSVQAKINKIKQLRTDQERELKNLLYSKFIEASKGAEMAAMAKVAPIVRRPVSVEITGEYPELGIRNFGKGTFHKPALKGIEVGTKKLFTIKEDDLLFSNVFAWEGGIAVVKPEDNNRVGSHRFISCVCNDSQALPEFLWYYFLSEEGLEKIRLASPGGAGRNRTLGLKKLEKIEVPIPEINTQKEFVQLKRQVEHTLSTQQTVTKDLADLMPSLLDKAFKGEL